MTACKSGEKIGHTENNATKSNTSEDLANVNPGMCVAGAAGSMLLDHIYTRVLVRLARNESISNSGTESLVSLLIELALIACNQDQLELNYSEGFVHELTLENVPGLCFGLNKSNVFQAQKSKIKARS